MSGRTTTRLVIAVVVTIILLVLVLVLVLVHGHWDCRRLLVLVLVLVSRSAHEEDQQVLARPHTAPHDGGASDDFRYFRKSSLNIISLSKPVQILRNYDGLDSAVCKLQRETERDRERERERESSVRL